MPLPSRNFEKRALRSLERPTAMNLAWVLPMCTRFMAQSSIQRPQASQTESIAWPAEAQAVLLLL